MTKIDLKAVHRALFAPPRDSFVMVTVPTLTFLKVDGAGDPNTATSYRTSVEWLYGVSYAMKFAARTALGRDYVVPPLEALWWADDPGTFVRREKDLWRWTLMIMVPDFLTQAAFEVAVAQVAAKRTDRPETLRFEAYDEGGALQTLHVGPYDAEGPILQHLHEAVMPGLGMTFNGAHHEIYLSDPRRTEPARLKTILRQPVRAC